MNIKRLSLVCGIAGLSIWGAYAVPAKPGLRVFTQPDGSKITVKVVGDEFFHATTTSDGRMVERADDGFFYYKTTTGRSQMRASNPGNRSAIENEYLSKNEDALSFQTAAKSKRTAINAKRAAARKVVSRASSRQVPCVGSPKIPILLVQYKDYKFKDSDPKKTFTSFFTAGEKSCHQYFVDQSNGAYTPQFDVYGPYTLANNRSTYGGNDYSGNDKGVGKMVAEAAQGLNSQIDFSQYDNDGDGECDVVIVLYAGDGEASSYDDDYENSVWPCQWSLSSSDYKRSLTFDNTKVDKFAVFNELNGSDLSKIDGIGTFCHEFSHCLDLPDFYDTNYGNHFGMANWSLLDNGCYNDDGYTPIGYSAYEKEFMGWISIPEATENTKYTLPVFNQKKPETDKAVKLVNERDNNEYFILENRARQGWDAYIPTDGLLIYHVTYNKSVWEENTVNDYDMQRMVPVPADNELKLNKVNYYGETYYEIDEKSLLGDLWPYNGNADFTDDSKPAAKVNTGSYLGKPITEITRNSDGTISFWAMKALLPRVSTPQPNQTVVHNPTSATLSWQPVSENVTYTLEVAPHSDTKLLVSTTFNNDNHGWEDAGFVEIDKTESAARLGSNKQKGSLTSPSFKIENQNKVTVNFTAKYYGSDESDLQIDLLDTNLKTVASETVSLTSQMKEYTVTFDATPNSEYHVELLTIANKKRAYIKSADIYAGTPNKIKMRASSETKTFTGITTTSYRVEGLTAGAKYDWRVKAVPVDPQEYTESNWSEISTLDMNGFSAVSTIEASEMPAVYYTLQGVALHAYPTQPGIYLMQQGGKTTKILVK